MKQSDKAEHGAETFSQSFDGGSEALSATVYGAEASGGTMTGTENSAVRDEVSALTVQLEAERARHAEELARLRAESALREALIRGGAYNPTVAIGAIDFSDMAGDERELRLMAERKTATLRGSDPYLFRAVRHGLSTGSAHGTTSDDPDDLTDSEYYSRRHM